MSNEGLSEKRKTRIERQIRLAHMLGKPIAKEKVNKWDFKCPHCGKPL